MSHANNMTNLVNKIEKTLGLMPLTPHLPDKYNKDAWAEVIKDQSLTTFSRYFPWKVPFHVDGNVPKRNGWYIIDEEKYFGQTGILLGVQDIDWQDFSSNNLSIAQISGYGAYVDFYGMDYSMEDMMLCQMGADAMSLFNRGLYIDFREPNMFRIMGSASQPSIQMTNFTVSVLLKHHDDLQTISPTKMETFEQLARSDVARFLAKNLKYWDQFETVFASVDLKLSDLEEEAGKRDGIIDRLEQSYVTAANDAIPYMITV
jgi:hypothetical protein